MALRFLRSRSTSAHHSPVASLLSPISPSSLPDRLLECENRLINFVSRNQRRLYFTATQAAAALRPFYFAVHPDLFGLYPEMYRTNEQSLKALNGYIDGLYTGTRPNPWAMIAHPAHTPKPITLKFYVRDRKKDQKKEQEKPASIKSVQVDLRERDPCAAVRSILESCDLSTEHLPPPKQLPWRAPVGIAMRREFTMEEAASDEELMRFWSSSKKKKRSVEMGEAGFRDWLAKNIHQAERMRSEYELLEMDVKRKIDEIKSMTGLIDVDFSLSWTLTHCRGCLLLFRKALVTNRVPVVNLKGWILKFARHNSYISLDRSIVLGMDDLPSDWMSLIGSLNHQHAYFGDLPNLEKRLSDLLGHAVITGPADTPVRNYRHRLITLADRLSSSSINRYRGTNLRRLHFVIENEACGLAMTENGRLSIPYTITADALYEFLDQNGQAAIDMMDVYEIGIEELKELRRECVEKWKLESIDWSEIGLSQDSLKSCLERLLDLADGRDNDLKSMLQGHRLHFGPQESFALMPDGRLSIPCDWRV